MRHETSVVAFVFGDVISAASNTYNLSLGKPSKNYCKKIAPKEKKFGNFYLLLYLEEIWF